ncbi:hypothetical protein L1049_014148 [Liquidambar formosana]|uniref:Uncharacterized protein n=1 Tax=Liquidambar formosana TaxID=63359 RepID=A0AAP0RRE9_LIQFO
MRDHRPKGKRQWLSPLFCLPMSLNQTPKMLQPSERQNSNVPELDKVSSLPRSSLLPCLSSSQLLTRNRLNQKKAPLSFISHQQLRYKNHKSGARINQISEEDDERE